MKCLLLLPAALALSFCLRSQSILIPDSPSDHHQSLASWMDHIDTMADSSSMPSRSWLLHNRWQDFWQGRLSLDPEEGWTPSNLLESYQSIPTPDAEGWNWEYAGPGNFASQNNGRVECAATPEGPDFLEELLLGSPTGGIWRSSDGGLNWHCTTDDDFTMPGLGCHWLCYHPQNPQVVFASITLATAAEVSNTGKEMGYGLGIYRSDDGGESWSATPFSFDPAERQMTTRILPNPENGDQMYAAVNDKVYFTEDAWDTFTLVFDELNQSYAYRNKVIADLAFTPGNFSKLWVSSTGVESWTWIDNPIVPGEYRYHAAELWRTENTALPEVAWTSIQTPLHPSNYQGVSNTSQPSKVMLCTLDETNPDHLYVGYKLFQGLAYVWKSQDGGASWQQVLEDNLDNVDGHFQLEMEISPSHPNRLYLAQRRVNLYDLNNLQNPPEELFGPHVDTRFLRLLEAEGEGSSSEELLLQGNDGGLAAITRVDDYMNWENLNGSGLGIQQLYGLAVVPEPHARIVAGSQDNFAFRNTADGWDNYLSGDRYDPIIRADGSGLVPVNPHSVSEFSDVHASDFSGVSPDPQGSAYFNRPVAQDQNGRMYIGYSDLWTLEDVDSEWLPLSNLGHGKVRAIAVSSEGSTGIIGYSGATWGGPTEEKLMVSTNLDGANPGWFDLTAVISSAIGGLGISALAIDPANENRVIIGFEFFHNGQEELRVAEVMLDPNSPQMASVQYMGLGLPNVPVNDLCFIPGTRGELLLGNDIGVYRWNGAFWEAINGEMPLVFVSDIEFDPFGNSVWISTFGRGLWRADLPCESSDPVVLQEDTEWSGNHWITSPVIVPDGVNLTISGTCHFQEESGIQVQPGGRLELSGWLTSACENSYWPGIEAVGQEDLPQHPAFQATVDLHEGAVIEKARIGVLLGSSVEGSEDYANGGGMLYADRVGFRDNAVSVAFAAYRDLNDLGYSIANKSRITRSSFKITSEHPGVLRAHVSLDNVNRVYLAGCSFLGDDESPVGTGILSRNATFMIEAACSSVQPPPEECPDGNGIRNRFSGLKRGVDARAWMDTETFAIRQSDFESCNYALRAVGVMYASVRESSIEVPEYVGDEDLPYYGIHFIGCSGYEIAGNSLYANDPSDEGIGLIITDSEDDPNRVEGNEFHHLSYAILAQGDNRDHTPNPESEWDPTSANSGLQFLCNRFWDNDYDLSVTQEGMIAAVQGSPNPDSPFGVDPAHNEFYTTACADANNLHINPDSEGYFYYYPEGDNLLIPDFGCFNESEVWLQEIQPELLPYPAFVYEEVCAIEPSNDDYPSSLGHWSSTFDTWELLQTEVKALTDGGDSQHLMDFVSNPAHDQKELKVKLLPISPWISDPVLHEVLNRQQTLDDITLYQLLAANAPLSPALWSRLESEDIIEPWWMEQLEDLQSGSNAFFRAQTQLCAIRNEMQERVRQAIQSGLVAADSCLVSEMLSPLSKDKRNNSLRILAALGQKAGKEFHLPEEYQDTMQDFYPEFCAAFVQSGAFGTECEPLYGCEGWRAAATHPLFEENLGEFLSIPLPQTKSSHWSPTRGDGITVQPNPSGRLWKVTGFARGEMASWTLYSSKGELLHQGKANAQEDELSIDCSHLPVGTYTLKIRTASQLFSAKLVRM